VADPDYSSRVGTRSRIAVITTVIHTKKNLKKLDEPSMGMPRPENVVTLTFDPMTFKT